MADLLLELFSEEIPARMQRPAADDLKRLVTGALVEADATYEAALAHATPRRLALHVVGLPEAQPHRREERKGPRVGAPESPSPPLKNAFMKPPTLALTAPCEAAPTSPVASSSDCPESDAKVVGSEPLAASAAFSPPITADSLALAAPASEGLSDSVK